MKKIDNMTIQLTTDGVQEPFWASPNPMQPMPKHIYETLDPATAFDTTALQRWATGRSSSSASLTSSSPS